VKYGEFATPGIAGRRIAHSSTTKINRDDLGLSFSAILDGGIVASEEIQIAIEGGLVKLRRPRKAAAS